MAISEVVQPGAVGGVLLAILVTWFVKSRMTVDWRASLPRRTRKVPRPPLNAEFLFYLFMTPQNCNALVGDLEERFKLIHKKFGRRRANFWYWTQTVMSVGPIIFAATKKTVKRLSGLAALVGLYRKIRS